jgi:transketolase
MSGKTAIKRNMTLDKRVTYLKEKAREARLHVLDMVYTVQSGHIGGSFSVAEIMAALYFDILRIDPQRPDWPERDRFILSKGHVCPILYACLGMRGYFPMETLKTLRQFGSILQGHPVIKTPGVDMSTGSLGMGFGIAAGMALNAKLLGAKHTVYALLGDGECNEGMVWEVCQTAAKYKLNNLVAIVDRNGMQNDGFSDEIMPIDPLDKRFEAFNWRVTTVDGHNLHEVIPAIEEARDYQDGPCCVLALTTKGKGVSFMENNQYWHGKAPTKEQYEQAIEELSRS